MNYNRMINGLSVTAEYSDESVETVFLPLLRGLTAMQKRLGRRVVVMLAAPPAAGKSTLASFLQFLSGQTPGVTPITAIGMDGFHRYQDYLLSHTVVRDGKEIPMVKIKGAPVTFDLDTLADRIRRVREGEVCPWPEYDRTLHNPVDGAVTVAGDIVLIEGNYLLLNEPGWRELKNCADYTIRILAEVSELRERLIARKAASGVSHREAEEFVDNSDIPNAVLCINRTAEADLTLKLEKDGSYRLAGGALPGKD